MQYNTGLYRFTFSNGSNQTLAHLCLVVVTNSRVWIRINKQRLFVTGQGIDNIVPGYVIVAQNQFPCLPSMIDTMMVGINKYLLTRINALLKLVLPETRNMITRYAMNDNLVVYHTPAKIAIKIDRVDFAAIAYDILTGETKLINLTDHDDIYLVMVTIRRYTDDIGDERAENDLIELNRARFGGKY